MPVIRASEFKAKCLALMDEVARTTGVGVPLRVAILSAINLADEVFRLRAAKGDRALQDKGSSIVASEAIAALAPSLGMSVEDLGRRIASLGESNPMLGLRGCRLGLRASGAECACKKHTGSRRQRWAPSRANCRPCYRPSARDHGRGPREQVRVRASVRRSCRA